MFPQVACCCQAESLILLTHIIPIYRSFFPRAEQPQWFKKKNEKHLALYLRSPDKIQGPLSCLREENKVENLDGRCPLWHCEKNHGTFCFSTNLSKKLSRRRRLGSLRHMLLTQTDILLLVNLIFHNAGPLMQLSAG